MWNYRRVYNERTKSFLYKIRRRPVCATGDAAAAAVCRQG